MADIKISQLYSANLIAKSDELPIIVATGATAPCQWNTRRATVETIVSGGFNGSPMSQSIANNILQASASLSVVNLWTSSLSQSVQAINVWTSSLSSSVQTINIWTSSLSSSVQAINIWTSSLSESVQTINAWTGSNTASFAGTSSYAILAESCSYVFSLQEVTTKGFQTSQSIQISASLANGLDVQAIGVYSHAEGRLTTTVGRYSNAAGFGTVALSDYQNVVGEYNIPTAGDGAFIIGNGSAGATSNLLYANERRVDITGSLNIGTPNLIDSVNISSPRIVLPLLGNYINDAAATLGGVPIGGLYRNNNVVSIRVI